METMSEADIKDGIAALRGWQKEMRARIVNPPKRQQQEQAPQETPAEETTQEVAPPQEKEAEDPRTTVIDRWVPAPAHVKAAPAPRGEASPRLRRKVK